MDVTKIVIFAVLAIALIISGAQRQSAVKRAVNAEFALADTKSQLDTERRLRAADQAAVASVNKKLTALRAQKGKQDVQLKAALVADGQWANAPVPDSVRAALRVRHATND